jgi:hypothetical protein
MAQASNDLRDELLTVERQGWDALCNGSGSEFYGSTMAEDGVMVLANGSVLDRDSVIASLRDAPAWDTYTIDDVRLVTGAADAAGLVYRAVASRGDFSFTGVMTSFYVRDGQDWRLAVYTQTPASGDG